MITDMTLSDDSGFVRSVSAEALGKLGNRSAVVPLLRVLTGEALPAELDGTSEVVISDKGTNATSENARLKLIKVKTKTVQALAELRATEALDPIIRFGLKAEDPELRAKSAVAIAMGPLGAASRLLAGKFRAEFTFATLAPDKASAPGQIGIRQMKDEYHADRLTPGTKLELFKEKGLSAAEQETDAPQPPAPVSR